jgi:hypothetical protein
MSVTDAINEFSKQYPAQSENGAHLGMRYLMKHWLDIGVEIRRGYET